MVHDVHILALTPILMFVYGSNSRRLKTPVKEKKGGRSPIKSTGSGLDKEDYSAGKTLPHDNSLKDSIAFESLHPFTWCKSIPASIEARGLIRFAMQQSQPSR